MSIFHVLIHSPRDTKILWASVFLRLTAYGSSNLVLTLYLKSLGIDEDLIGIFMTLTLIGDTIISYFLTWYADYLGRRTIMILGSALMIVSGLIFAKFETVWILLLASIFGVISPSGDEVGPFKSIEESSIAHLTPLQDRADVYALHWILGTFGSAFGSLISGGSVTFLVDHYGYDLVDAYRCIFYLYSTIGALKLILMLFLSEKTELNYKELETESSSLLERTSDESVETSTKLSKESISVLIKLCSIFMLDSLGSGFINNAWLVYYLKITFLKTSAILGTLFFITNICNSISALPSSILAKKFGPIKTTLLVQIPSCIFMMLIPLISQNFYYCSILIVLYFSTSAMDVVPRQILLTGLIKPKDLTKCLGIVNICKTFARCIGPIITGALASRGLIWISFLIDGGLVLCADFLLTILFYGIDEKFIN